MEGLDELVEFCSKPTTKSKGQRLSLLSTVSPEAKMSWHAGGTFHLLTD